MSKQAVRLNKWVPSYPTPPKDNIVSSQSKANNERGFIPTYESEGRPNMYCLVSDEYRRMWFKERGQYEKEVYTKKEMMKEESKIKRRYVQRCLVPKKREKQIPIIQLKRFRDIGARTEHSRPKKKEKARGNPEHHDVGGDAGHHEEHHHTEESHKDQKEREDH